MELLVLKIILLLLMVIVTFSAGMIPVRLLRLLRKSAAAAATSAKQRSLSLVLCLLTCFSGGVFLATCFLHLFPELNEQLTMIKENYHLEVSYPLAELLSCLGFFLLFFLEEVFLLALPGLGHSHGPPNARAIHGHGHGVHDYHGHEAEYCCHGSGIEADLGRTDIAGETRACIGSCTSDVKEEESPKRGLLCSNGNSSRHLSTVGQCAASIRIDCHLTSPSADDTSVLLSRNYHSDSYGSMSSLSANSHVKLCKRRKALTLAEPEACETNCETVNEDPPILMKSQPHAHSHGIRSITFVLAISFHSVIEGLAFGVQDDPAEVGALFISLMVHKVIVAFSVGLQLARTHAHALRRVCASVLLLASMSPLGAVVGMFVQSSQMDTQIKDYIILLFQGLAVGTFIYVTFFEVLLHERDNEHPNLLKLLFMLVGFALIGSLRLLDDHAHEHGHSHDHEG